MYTYICIQVVSFLHAHSEPAQDSYDPNTRTNTHLLHTICAVATSRAIIGWGRPCHLVSGISVLQCVAACCSVLQCVAVCCSVMPLTPSFAGAALVTQPLVRKVCCSVLQRVTVCSSNVFLQCVAVYCCVLQCVAVCCSVLLCVAVYCCVFLRTVCLISSSHAIID